MIGITIDFIEQAGYNIFDFPYQWQDVNYLGKSITKQTIEDDFKDYYRYYNISLETIESFKFELKRKWLKNVTAFNQLLLAQPTLDLNEEKRTLSRNTEGQREDNWNESGTDNSTSNYNSDNKFSDTPNQPMDGETSYLTNRTIDTNTDKTEMTSEHSGENTRNNTEDVNEEENRSKNETLRFYEIAEQYRDMQYEFYDKFTDLFQTLLQIGEYRKRRCF